MNMDEIVLSNEVRVPGVPGRYQVTPPPDLNDTVQDLFFMEYDYPELISQVYDWIRNHGNTGGASHLDRCGYEFNWSSSPSVTGYLQQLIPDMSYVDEHTWSTLSSEEKDMMFIPCVPAVVVQLMTDADNMADLQTKVSRFIDAGTREGVIVDISGNRVWIHNQGEEPRFGPLAAIEFDSWPGFTLDCIKILEGREQERVRLLSGAE